MDKISPDLIPHAHLEYFFHHLPRELCDFKHPNASLYQISCHVTPTFVLLFQKYNLSRLQHRLHIISVNLYQNQGKKNLKPKQTKKSKNDQK